MRLWKARRDGDDGLEVEEEPVEAGPFAFVGVRACELAAIAIQDRVFLGGQYVDRDYAARRENAFLVAVNCHEPAGTCFCVSMDTGPTAREGYDLVLTELFEAGHRFLVEAGSERGEEILGELGGVEATENDLRAGVGSRPRTRPDGWAATSTRTTSATCFATISSTRVGTRSRSGA